MLLRLIFAYAAVCALMWGFQRQLVFHPTADLRPPQAYGLTDFHEITLTDRDGTHIKAWLHDAPQGQPTIIFFHGNGGVLGNRADYFGLLADAGFGLLAVEYRGYGGGEGSPASRACIRTGGRR